MRYDSPTALPFVVVGFGAVLLGLAEGLVQGNLYVGHAVGQGEGHRLVLRQAQEGAEALLLLLHVDLGVHDVGLLDQAVDLQLQHLVLGDEPDVVASLGHLVERVGRCVVLLCHLQLVLGRSQLEEVSAGVGGDKLQGLGIVLLGLAEAEGLDAAVPLEGVVAEEVLRIADAEGLTAVGGDLVGQLVQAVDGTVEPEVATRQGDVLADAQTQAGVELVLLEEG